MQYFPLVKPKDIAVKNNGKLIVLKILGKEYEMQKATIEQLVEMVAFMIRVKHPTEWVTGYEDIAREETLELWPEGPSKDDDDPIVGAV